MAKHQLNRYVAIYIKCDFKAQCNSYACVYLSNSDLLYDIKISSYKIKRQYYVICVFMLYLATQLTKDEQMSPLLFLDF